ncbi:G-protein coupled receptor Mth2-like isoform X2 [Hylaeus volcanicus]|uniref:G-protein coupled receptor Mth2-like isoform X2 n=1 Tax=Hylaeus volcanicus TaxID=313075 RepID=UPI0023B84705|nr:G-protein coupled receptor Mth2-like isoform X2 [Hylaeus volcanicus]
MDYDHDHNWLTILVIWLLSTRSVFATSVVLSSTECLCNEENITRVEPECLVKDANNNKPSRDFDGFDDFGSSDEAKNKRTNVSRIPFPLCEPLASRACCNNHEETNVTFHLPSIYDSVSLELLVEDLTRERFRFFLSNPRRDKYLLEPNNNIEDHFMYLNNGSIYQDNIGIIREQSDFCFRLEDNDTFNVLVSFDVSEGDGNVLVSYPVGMIVSVPFLLATLIVYTLIPELHNIHGRTLRGYVGSLLVAYTTLAILQISPQEHISDKFCVLLALVIHFSFLASFFWLNVMCFDIWWTFRGFRSLQGSAKQRERKKFMIYSIYAWGCASILTGISILMHFLPDIPKHFVRPEFGEESCWFAKETAKAIYFYGPMGVTILCNICLFVSTALKIVRHKKDTARHFKDADSKRHDDHKQWFNLYLKLFIVMGINWSMEIISWLCNNSPEYIWYLTDITNTLQGVIIFFIFVWKDKVKQHLLKRLCCRDDNILSRNSTRSAYHSSTTRSTYPFSSESARTVK